MQRKRDAEKIKREKDVSAYIIQTYATSFSNPSVQQCCESDSHFVMLSSCFWLCRTQRRNVYASAPRLLQIRSAVVLTMVCCHQCLEWTVTTRRSYSMMFPALSVDLLQHHQKQHLCQVSASIAVLIIILLITNYCYIYTYIF